MYYKKAKNILFILFTFTILSLLSSCAKENPVDKLIPYVRVDLQINPLSPQFVPDLSTAGNWAYLNGGHRGIIIYNAGFGEYRAYERTAPYNYPNASSCKVSVDDSGFLAEDPCSGSKYSMLDGTPYEGPALLSLKQYRTQFDGVYLRIFN